MAYSTITSSAEVRNEEAYADDCRQVDKIQVEGERMRSGTNVMPTDI